MITDKPANTRGGASMLYFLNTRCVPIAPTINPTPTFINQKGTPKTIDELEQREMIVFATEEDFENKVHTKAKKGKRGIQINPKFLLKVNDMKTYLESTLLGLGISILPSKFISKYVDNNTQLCGFYDKAGEFSFRVGLPGKSRVGGGNIAIHPGKYSIAVWSSKLNSA